MSAPGYLVVVVARLVASALVPVVEETPATPPTRTPQMKINRDPKEVRKAVAEIMRVATALDRAPALTTQVIEGIVGVRLRPSRHANARRHEYEGDLRSGPFLQLRFRDADPEGLRRGQVLAMDAKLELGVNVQDFDKQQIGRWTGSNPYTGTYNYTLDRPGKRTIFGFRSSDGLFVGVYFHRGPAVEKR
jgi:hypothetical protein